MERKISKATFLALLIFLYGCASTHLSHISHKPYVEARAEKILAALKEYVKAVYLKPDAQRAENAKEELALLGVPSQEMVPIGKINRILIPMNLFLYYYCDPFGPPVIKIFAIERKDLFDGFIISTRKHTRLFGKDMGSYTRILLGKELFTTRDVPPLALHMNLYPEEPNGWVIAIPYWSLLEFQSRYPQGAVERLVEELTIHEIAHIVNNTDDELIAFLAQFGYRMQPEIEINTVEEIITFLAQLKPSYGNFERFVLNRICYAELYYSKSANMFHLQALRRLREGLRAICQQIARANPAFTKDLLKISDQQLYASLAYMYSIATREKEKENKTTFALRLLSDSTDQKTSNHP